MLARLILLFTLVPVAELVLLIWLGGKIGLLPTFALVLLTGVLGASLARYQGLSTLRRFQAALAAGRSPGGEVAEGLLILVAGAVLLTPGVLTDAAGFALLVPPLRRAVAARLGAWATRRLVVVAPRARSGTGRGPAARETVVDAEFEIVDDDSNPS